MLVDYHEVYNDYNLPVDLSGVHTVYHFNDTINISDTKSYKRINKLKNEFIRERDRDNKIVRGWLYMFSSSLLTVYVIYLMGVMA